MTAPERAFPSTPVEREQAEATIWRWLSELRCDPKHRAVTDGLTTWVGSVEPLSERLARSGLATLAAMTRAFSTQIDPHSASELYLLELLSQAAVRLAAEASHLDMFILCDEIWTIATIGDFAPSDAVVDYIRREAGAPVLVERLRDRLQEEIASPFNARVDSERPLTTRLIWPGPSDAMVWDSWAYQAVARLWPQEFWAMLSEVPLAFAHAAVSAASSSLRVSDVEALLASAPPAFSVDGMPNQNAGIFALLDELGDALVDVADGRSRTLEAPAIAEVMRALLARSDGQWLTRAWLQRLIWKNGVGRIGYGDVRTKAFQQFLSALAHGIDPPLPDPFVWIEQEEELWRDDRVFAEASAALSHGKIVLAGDLLAQAIERGIISSTGRSDGMNSGSAEAMIVGSTIAKQSKPADWFERIWRRTYSVRERLRHHTHRSLDNPAYPALTWGLSALNCMIGDQEQAVLLWQRICDALIETRLTDVNAEIPNGPLAAATLVAGKIGSSLVACGVLPPGEFAPLLEHMVAPTEEFALFMACTVSVGIGEPLIAAARHVDPEFFTEALAGALEVVPPRSLRAAWGVPQALLNDVERRLIEDFGRRLHSTEVK